MNDLKTRTTQGLVALSTSLLLVACGGGGSDSPPSVAFVNGTNVPVSATVDNQAAFDFVSSVVAKGEANTEDPLILGDAALAFSEIADPVTIVAA